MYLFGVLVLTFNNHAAADVRRAYKRVARLIHPDKLAKGNSVEAVRQQLFGQKLFALFTAEMDRLDELEE